jgi:hypothetical protein
MKLLLVDIEGLRLDVFVAALVYGWPGMELGLSEKMRIAVNIAIDIRCRNEGGRLPSSADLLTGLLALL